MPVSQNSLTPISFHDDTIFIIEHQGEPFAPVKPVVENMGLDWSSQRQKLASNEPRWGVVMIATPSSGGLQKTLCLPVRKLAGFLATINPKKVKYELREKIRQYQNECDDALWDYWTKGQATRPAYENEFDQSQETLENKYIKLLESHIEMLKQANTSPSDTGTKAKPAKRAYTKNTPLTQEEVNTILRLKDEGFGATYIAKQVGRGRSLVNYVLRGLRAAVN